MSISLAYIWFTRIARIYIPEQHHSAFLYVLKFFIGIFLELSCIYLFSCSAAELWMLECADKILLLHVGFASKMLLLEDAHETCDVS